MLIFCLFKSVEQLDLAKIINLSAYPSNERSYCLIVLDIVIWDLFARHIHVAVRRSFYKKQRKIVKYRDALHSLHF